MNATGTEFNAIRRNGETALIHYGCRTCGHFMTVRPKVPHE